MFFISALGCGLQLWGEIRVTRACSHLFVYDMLFALMREKAKSKQLLNKEGVHRECGMRKHILAPSVKMSKHSL